MQLKRLKERFAVCKLPADAEIDFPTAATLFSVTRTKDELSIVCEESLGPKNAERETGWSALRIVGQIPFDTYGVIATLTRPLATAQVGVFVVSTFDTDYLLWKHADTDTVIDTLSRAGYEFV